MTFVGAVGSLGVEGVVLGGGSFDDGVVWCDFLKIKILDILPKTIAATTMIAQIIVSYVP